MYHFFIKEEQLSLDTIRVYDKDAHHMKDVLRIKPGEEVSFCIEGHENKEYRCELTGYEEDTALYQVLFVKEKNVELPCSVSLYQGLPKADKMETVIQKAVELGAFEIVPVACKRSVVRLDDKRADKKIVRWQAISEAAAKQSQRGMIPEVGNVFTFEKALERAAKDADHIIIPYEKAENMEATRMVVKSISPGDKVAVFIGPEGGFTPEEIEKVISRGGKSVTLGRRILRTETAGMAFLSFLVYELEM